MGRANVKIFPLQQPRSLSINAELMAVTFQKMVASLSRNVAPAVSLHCLFVLMASACKPALARRGLSPSTHVSRLVEAPSFCESSEQRF